MLPIGTTPRRLQSDMWRNDSSSIVVLSIVVRINLWRLSLNRRGIIDVGLYYLCLIFKIIRLYFYDFIFTSQDESRLESSLPKTSLSITSHSTWTIKTDDNPLESVSDTFLPFSLVHVDLPQTKSQQQSQINTATTLARTVDVVVLSGASPAVQQQQWQRQVTRPIDLADANTAWNSCHQPESVATTEQT